MSTNNRKQKNSAKPSEPKLGRKKRNAKLQNPIPSINDDDGALPPPSHPPPKRERQRPPSSSKLVSIVDASAEAGSDFDLTGDDDEEDEADDDEADAYRAKYEPKKRASTYKTKKKSGPSFILRLKPRSAGTSPAPSTQPIAAQSSSNPPQQESSESELSDLDSEGDQPKFVLSRSRSHRHSSRRVASGPQDGVFAEERFSDRDDDLPHDTKLLWEFAQPNGDSLMVTWSEGEEGGGDTANGSHSIGDELEVDGLEELLAWGNGEIELADMPSTTEGQAPWFEDAESLVCIELGSSDDSSSSDGLSDGEDSMNSSDDADQLLLLDGLYDSGSDGDTTDTLDDADHAGLARFGIECDTDDEFDAPTTLPVFLPQGRPGRPKKAKKSKKADKGKAIEAPPAPPVDKASQPEGPVLGEFDTPQPSIITGLDTMAVIDGEATTTVLSPFSVTRMRRPRRSSDVSPSKLSRRPSISSLSTLSAPSLLADRPSPEPDIPEADEDDEDDAVYMDMDIDDVVHASMLHSPDFNLILAESEVDTDMDNQQASMSDLTRWNRIPIGAFRRSRSSNISPNSSAFPPALRRGATGSGLNSAESAYYLPIAAAIFAAGPIRKRALQHATERPLTRLRRKVTRQEAIALSPVLLPMITTKAPSSVKSRKGKREERKAAKRKTRSSSTVSVVKPTLGSTSSSAEPPGSASTLHTPNGDVPDFSLPMAISSPGASVPVSASMPVPHNLLPVPTLPSAGCPPLFNSPLFSAVGASRNVPTFGMLSEPIPEEVI